MLGGFLVNNCFPLSLLSRRIGIPLYVKKIAIQIQTQNVKVIAKNCMFISIHNSFINLISSIHLFHPPILIQIRKKTNTIKEIILQKEEGKIIDIKKETKQQKYQKKKMLNKILFLFYLFLILLFTTTLIHNHFQIFALPFITFTIQ